MKTPTTPARPFNCSSLRVDVHLLRSWLLQAGKIALRYFDQAKAEPGTPDENLASQADREIEAYLTNHLRTTYPDHCVIGEEFGQVETKPSSPIWTIDPLDGTTVFNQGMPEWGIGLGLLWQGQPCLGLFYMPATQEMYYTDTLGTVYDIFGRPLKWTVRLEWGHKGFLATTASAHNRFKLDVRRTRAPGSVGVNLIYTARGTAAAAFLPKPCLWDLVAGAAILARTGGVLRYLSGQAVDYLALLDGRSTPEPVLAGSPQLVAELQATIKPLA